MRVALAVVGLQFLGHRIPQDPPANPEGGAPSPFCCAVNCKGGIRIRDDSTHKKGSKSSRMTRQAAIHSTAFSRLNHRTDLPIEKRHGACVRARLTSYSRSLLFKGASTRRVALHGPRIPPRRGRPLASDSRVLRRDVTYRTAFGSWACNTRDAKDVAVVPSRGYAPASVAPSNSKYGGGNQI